MSEHFAKFYKQQKETYLETAKKAFEISLFPIGTQLTQAVINNDLEKRQGAIAALVKVAHRRYVEILDELKAEGREAEAEQAFKEWIKGLSATYYDRLVAQYPAIAGRSK